MVEVLQLVEGYMDQSRVHQIATVNPEFIMTAQDDAEFRQILNEVDLCIPDGVGLLLAGRWLGQPLPERVAGSDLVYQLAEFASRHGWSLFLLGAGTGVAEEAGQILAKRYPGLTIAGVYEGSPNPAENEAIVKRINDSQAKILYVAYGAPGQDKWIARNRRDLTSVRLAIGIGGSLDFITGRSVRAPRWMQRLGLEWLHRLFKEPWRWRRMTSLPKFAYRVFRDSGPASR
jgi:N-acetylglucosaminyldiphosphoundecaprenol N-acetyl-beta-D-mannosaminyltransferase